MALPVAIPVDFDRLRARQARHVDLGVPALRDPEPRRSAAIAGVVGVGVSLVLEDHLDRPIEQLPALVTSALLRANSRRSAPRMSHRRWLRSFISVSTSF